MYRCILLIIVIQSILAHLGYPPTPQEFRGLWCIARWNETQQNYSQQIGQAFFYNNGTFTLNFLDNLTDTWINRFAGIHQRGGEGTYHLAINTSQGPLEYTSRLTCYWRRIIANGDILWGRQSNGTCTTTFELDTSDEATVYTRNALDCLYIDDENPEEIISNSSWENELLRFDRLIKDSKAGSIVFYGSSSIRLWSNLENSFPRSRWNIINRGFGGSTLKECSEEFKRVILPLEPNLLIIYAGENDLAGNSTPAEVRSIFRELIPRIRRYLPSLPIAFISIKPSPRRIHLLNEQNLTNSMIEEDIRTMSNVVYIDVFNSMFNANRTLRSELFLADRLHLNEQGYDIWRRAIDDYLHKNGFISRGSLDCQLSFLLFALNLVAFFITCRE